MNTRSIIRGYWVILAFLFPLPFPALSLDLPKTIGTMRFVERTDYERKDLGYSLRYQNPDLMKADLYFYDRGMQGLEDGTASDAVMQEMESVLRVLRTMEERGQYPDLQEVQRGEIECGRSGVKFLWARHTYQQVSGATVEYTGRRISDTYLRVQDHQFLKIRITTKQEDMPKHETELRNFIATVADHITAATSGNPADHHRSGDLRFEMVPDLELAEGETGESSTPGRV